MLEETRAGRNCFRRGGGGGGPGGEGGGEAALEQNFWCRARKDSKGLLGRRDHRSRSAEARRAQVKWASV